MKQIDIESLYKVFRDHEEVMGTSRTTTVALRSFRDSIRRLQCTPDNFRDLVLELNDVIKNTQPKIIPLVHLIEAFESEMQTHFRKPLDEARAYAIAIFDQKLALFESIMQRVVEHGKRIIKDGDLIITHSPSAAVRSALLSAHTDLHRQFRVVVLDQPFIRIKQFTSKLSEAGVEHLVIPEHNLSHFLDSNTKLFIGATSITPDRKVVASAGSSNIVSLCHLKQVEVYLLVNSLKFAHQIATEQHIYKNVQKKSFESLTYEQTIYSHDIVDFDLIDHVITEEGEVIKF